NYHFCDGGYSDTTGLLTAVKLVHDILDHYKDYRKKPRKFDRILVVRIEPFPPTEATMVKENTGLSSAFFGPTKALDNARVAMQAERADLELRLLQEVTNPLGPVSDTVLKAIAKLQINARDLHATNPDLANEVLATAYQANASVETCAIDAPS